MKRHPVELLSLISGTVFLAFAMVYLIGAAVDAYPDPRVSVALLLVGLGGAGLAAALRAQQRAD